jgi:hypothetical protein
MRKEAAQGRIPRNFNPETMTFSDDFDWGEIIGRQKSDAARELEQAQEEKRNRELLRTGNCAGQLSMQELF